LPSHTALLLIGGGDAVVMVVALPALAGYLPFAASHSPMAKRRMQSCQQQQKASL
jgi:hypothetical protein